MCIRDSPITVLEFDFKSDTEGEIHEISFDNDLTAVPDHRAVVYGNQGYSGDFSNPTYTGSGNYEHFTIQLGTNFTGTYQYLVLTCDDDANAAGDSYFKNIKIYEDYDGDLACTNAACPMDDALPGIIPSGSYQVSNKIISSGQIEMSSDVTFSGNLICLDSGFQVDAGGSLTAEINPCAPLSSSPNTSLMAEINKIKRNTLNEKGLLIHPLGNSKSAYILSLIHI